MTEFLLKSSNPTSSLILSNLTADSLDVELRTSSLSVSTPVCTYTYMPTLGLAEYFARLAGFGVPWTKEEIWETLEGDLRLTAPCDPLGHVMVKVDLASSYGSEIWSASYELFFEFGSLPKLAADAKRFCDAASQA